jgi:hypothetical protein
MTLVSRLGLIVMTLFSVMSVASLTFAQSTQATTVISKSLCNVVTSVQTVIGVISLVLFILGGALYAVAHMLPAAGNLRGNLQGWSLGMIVGGIVGLIIVIIAPYIIGTIIGNSSLAGTAITSCA